MSVLRYIWISILLSTVLFQSSSITVLALSDAGIAINSIDDLTLQAEVNKNTTNDDTIVIENTGVTIEQDIISLIAAQEAYQKIELL